MIRPFLLLFLVFPVLHCLGQRPGGGGGSFGGGGGGNFGGGGGGFGSLGNAGRGGGGGAIGEVTLDTSDIFYFFAENPHQIFPFTDSLLGRFQHYDPARQQVFDHGHLGNLGSAQRPLFHQPTFRRGFDTGLHQFDIYQISTADVRYYQIEQAYTQAGHSQGQTQADALTNVRFSRNFADGVNFSIEYRKIDNLGAFDTQQAKNTSTAVGFWHHNQHGTYDGFFGFTNNSIEQQDNGGIRDGADSVLTDAFRLDVNLATANTRHANREFAYTQYFYLDKIFSKEGSDRRSQRRTARKEEKAAKKEQRRQVELAFRDSLHQDSIAKGLLTVPVDSTAKAKTTEPAKIDTLSQTPPPTAPRPDDKRGQQPPAERAGIGPRGTAPTTGRPDASGRPPTYPTNAKTPTGWEVPEGRSFTLYHQTAWRTESYKFFAQPPDSLFFGGFWVDDRGLRHFLETKKLQNTFKLQTFKLRAAPPDPSGRALPNESDLLEVGIVHSLHLIDQEPLPREVLHNLFLTGNLLFSPGDRLRVRGHAHLGLAGNAGDFRLGGDILLKLKKIGSLHLEAVNQLSTPSLLHRRFFASGQLIWENDFGKTLETTLKGTYSLPSFGLAISGAYHLVNNLVFFDETGLARQNGSVVNVLQLSVGKDFHLGPVHSENWVGLQQTTSDNLRLPPVYSRHSLYIEGKIFKKAMLTRFGFDARLASGYRPYNYHPLTGQFALQHDRSLPFTPLVDAFLTFKVKTFRFFLKVENLMPYFTKQYYFQTATYPMPFGMENGGLRMGVNWRLVD